MHASECVSCLQGAGNRFTMQSSPRANAPTASSTPVAVRTQSGSVCDLTALGCLHPFYFFAGEQSGCAEGVPRDVGQSDEEPVRLAHPRDADLAAACHLAARLSGHQL